MKTKHLSLLSLLALIPLYGLVGNVCTSSPAKVVKTAAPADLRDAPNANWENSLNSGMSEMKLNPRGDDFNPTPVKSGSPTTPPAAVNIINLYMGTQRIDAYDEDGKVITEQVCDGKIVKKTGYTHGGSFSPSIPFTYEDCAPANGKSGNWLTAPKKITVMKYFAYTDEDIWAQLEIMKKNSFYGTSSILDDPWQNQAPNAPVLLERITMSPDVAAQQGLALKEIQYKVYKPTPDFDGTLHRNQWMIRLDMACKYNTQAKKWQISNFTMREETPSDMDTFGASVTAGYAGSGVSVSYSKTFSHYNFGMPVMQKAFLGKECVYNEYTHE